MRTAVRSACGPRWDEARCSGSRCRDRAPTKSKRCRRARFACAASADRQSDPEAREPARYVLRHFVVEIRIRDRVRAELLPQIFSRDAEQLRGACTFAARHRERFKEMLALRL